MPDGYMDAGIDTPDAADDALREQLAKAVAKYQACGYREGDCRTCLEEADALLHRFDTYSEWGIRNHDGYIEMRATEASARQSYADMSNHTFRHQAVVRRAVAMIRGEWKDADRGASGNSAVDDEETTSTRRKTSDPSATKTTTPTGKARTPTMGDKEDRNLQKRLNKAEKKRLKAARKQADKATKKKK